MKMLRYLGIILSLYATLDAKSSILDAFFQDKPEKKTQPGYYYPTYPVKSDTERKKQYNTLMKGPKVSGYIFFSQTEMHLAKHFYDKNDLKTDDQQVINMCHRLVERELEEQKKDAIRYCMHNRGASSFLRCFIRICDAKFITFNLITIFFRALEVAA